MATLPGAVLNFDAGTSEYLIRRGEDDTWQRLERAGWLDGAGRALSRAGRVVAPGALD